MDLKSNLESRSHNQCELCSAKEELSIFTVPPRDEESLENSLLLCSKCLDQVSTSKELDANHWRCLSESMWSEFPAVQVLSWRVLHQLSSVNGWAQDLLDQMYLDEEMLNWAQSGVSSDSGSEVITKDSNGTVLNAGDSVTLIKDLVVKGANFTAKRGTLVKNISLTDNPEHIEGKVNGTQIVLVAKFLKKV